MQLAALIFGQGIEFCSLLQRMSVDVKPGANVAVPFLDPLQAGLYEFRCGKPVRLQRFQRLRCGQPVWRDGGWVFESMRRLEVHGFAFKAEAMPGGTSR